jgi:AcrR family transcriptional regulator
MIDTAMKTSDDTDSSVKPSGWDQRRERVSRDYERTALTMFAARGFPEVTVDDIAAELGISARTLFRYFPSKEDMLLGVPRRAQHLLLGALEGIDRSADPVTGVWRAFADLSVQYAEELDILLLWQRAATKAPETIARAIGERMMLIEDLVAGVFGEALGMDPATDVRPHALAASVASAAGSVLRFWQERGAVEDLRQLYDAAFTSLRQSYR